VNRLPDFIIIGAMKCATSTLHEQLARQPGIFMSSPKEPNFFSDDVPWSRGIDWYHELFRDAPSHCLCGESSTHYTKLPTYPKTVARMRMHLPAQTRFIYVMRHPIDRLISHYKHEWSQQVITVDIDEAITAHPELMEYGRYGMQLQPYFEAFGRERVLPVFYDRLATAPQEELERICRFIACPHQPEWVKDLPRQNVSGRRLQRTWLRNVLLNSRSLRALARRMMSRRMRERIAERWTVKVNTELSAERRAGLARVFDEDLARLGEWIGLTLTCETFKEIARAVEPAWVEPSRERVA
jgi:hypothetical protein